MKSFIIARVPIQFVDKDQPLSYALEIMDSKDLSALPVVDNGKFIGVITIRGIMNRIWSERVRIVDLSSLYVSSVMETDVPNISIDTTLIEACNLMIKHNSIALPILYDDKPIGMIFEEDIPRLFFDSNIDSSEFINRRFKVADLDSNILHIRFLMLNENIRFIPVVKDGKFLGVINDWDIVMALRAIHDRFPLQHRDARVRSLKASDVMRFTKTIFYGHPSMGVIARMIVENKSLGAIALDENRSIVGVVDLKTFVKIACGGF